MTNGTNGLVGLFVDDPVLFTDDDLQQMVNTWVFMEDDPLVIDKMVDEELGLDEIVAVDEGDGEEDVETEAESAVEVKDVVNGDSKPMSVSAITDAEESIE